MGITTLSLFSPEVSSNLTMSEKLAQILSTAVVGYIVVFAVLAVIWGILELIGKIFTKNSKKASDKAVSCEVGAAEPEMSSCSEQGGEYDETELVAVISAAISAYTDKPLSSFRVVSFRRNGKR